MITLGEINIHEDARLDPALESIPKTIVETMPTRNGPALRWEKILKDRPFDIVCGADVWVALSVIQSIAALAATLDWEGTLVAPGASMTCYFRHSDSPVIEYEPVIDYSTPDAADKVCEIRLKLVWKVT